MAKPEELRVGDFIKVISPSGTNLGFYSISAIDDVFYKDAHAALAAGATESFLEITNLNPSRGTVIWIGSIEVDGNVSVQVKQPAPTNRWGTTRSPTGGYLTGLHSPIRNGRMVDVWVSENFTPNTQIVNSTNTSITPTLWWIGKRFLLEASTDREGREVVPAIYTPIRIGGVNG